jgi:hypothetical protein
MLSSKLSFSVACLSDLEEWPMRAYWNAWLPSFASVDYVVDQHMTRTWLIPIECASVVCIAAPLGKGHICN